MKAAKHEVWRKSFPHYKVQYYDPRGITWREFQRNSFPTPQEALVFVQGRGLTRFRIIEVWREGRRVIVER